MKALQAQPIVSVLAALGDATRLRLLRTIDAHELTVGEVARATQLPQSTVSRHLKVLADAGLVSRRAEGTASYFSLVQDDLSTDARNLWSVLRSKAVTPSEKADDDRRIRAVLAERKTDSSAFFGSLGGAWEGLRTQLFGPHFTTLSLLGLLNRNWVIADLGCGTGSATEALAPFVDRVHAVEVSGPMLRAARERLKGTKNVTFVESPAESTGLRSASIDCAVCVLVLHHLDQPALVLREARRLLRTSRGGGTVLVVDMVTHDREEYRRSMGHKHQGFSQKQMTDLLDDAGFMDIRYTPLPLEPEAKGPGLFAATARIDPD